MYSETFMNNLLRYQNDDFKPVEPKEKSTNRFAFDALATKKYATIPINYETK